MVKRLKTQSASVTPSPPTVRQIVFSPAQALRYNELKSAAILAEARLSEAQNILALGIVDAPDLPRVSVTETANGLAVTVAASG